MNSPFTNLDFERFIYRQGQLLASGDFRDQQRMEAARRWMHNSAMHNAWGVAVGYEFSLPTFESITLADIMSADLSSNPINGSNNEFNQIPNGSILLYQTNEGRYGKLKIINYGYNLTLQWQTYDFDGSVYSEGNNLVIRGTFQCDLDSGSQSSNSADFWWEQVDEIQRFLVPENGAKFISYRVGEQLTWNKNATLTIHPGIAYDCFGRELILAQPQILNRNFFEDENGNLRHEFVLETFFLVLRYQEPAKSPANGCPGTPHSLVLPPPLLLWKSRNEARIGLEVPILSVSFTNVASVQRYSSSRVHPQARPKMASGQTVSGQTAWKSWEIQFTDASGNQDDIKLGLEVDIDTSDAEFQQTPCYFTWLNAPLLVIIDNRSFMLNPFMSLANETPDGFTVRILLPTILEDPIPAFRINPSQANQHKLTVCWLAIASDEMGVDMSAPPPLDQNLI